MSACTFFGHRECPTLDSARLESALEALIAEGADTFYVGHQGQFDAMVLSCLRRLRERHRQITACVVLAYLPGPGREDPYADCSIFPEGMEGIHPRFAIEERNRWMISRSDFCLCCIDHTWGGAWKFARQAKGKGLRVRNLGRAEL